MHHRATALGLFLLGTPILATAQEDDRREFRDRVCDEAIIRAQEVTPTADRSAVIENLSACGPRGGPLLARELSALRTVSDFDTLDRMFARIAILRDAEILRAAIELAEDRSATVEARVVAFRVFARYKDPSRGTSFGSFSLPWQDVAPGAARKRAPDSFVDHPIVRHGTALAIDWEDAVRDTLNRVAESPEEPEAVRYAATRAMSYLPAE